MQTVTSRSIRFTTLLCAAALAACSPDRPTGVSTEPFEGGGAANLSPTSDCSVSTLSAYAKTYFGSANNIASNDIKALGDACKAYVGAKGDTAKQSAAQRAADVAGFNIFRDIASVAGARSAYSSAGASLTVGVLGYMDIGTATQTGVDSALRAGGIYGVGTAGTLKTIFARNDGDRWGILAAWNRDVLVYGYPIGDASTGLPSASYKGAYDISTLPSSAAGVSPKPFDGQYSVGVCFRNGTTPTTRDFSDNVRVQHTNNPEFLYFTDGLCASQYALAEPTSMGSRMLAYAGEALGFFGPQQLLAGTTTKTGVGGFGSDLSPLYTPDLGGLVSTWVTQPSSSSTVSGGILPPVQVKVTTANGGIIVPGSTVALSVANNSGSPAGAYLSWLDPSHPNVCPPGIDPTTSVCTLVDPASGIATFTGVKTNKPGGYTLSAVSYFNGIFSPAVKSNLFQVQQ